jgi:hypothetical protein
MLFQTPTEFHIFLYVENINRWQAGQRSILPVEFLRRLGADEAGEFARVVVEVGEDWSEVLHA